MQTQPKTLSVISFALLLSGPLLAQEAVPKQIPNVHPPQGEDYYPVGAIRNAQEGRLFVELVVTPKGKVKDARIIKEEPTGAFKSVVPKLKKWHFDRGYEGPITVSILFRLNPCPAACPPIDDYPADIQGQYFL